MMKIEWVGEDTFDTLGHATKLTIGGKTTISPQHMLTTRDFEAIHTVQRTVNGLSKNIVLASESLGYPAFQTVGHESASTEALYKRLKAKKDEEKINVVYTRIPAKFLVENKEIYVTKLTPLQVSGLVGVALEADSDFIVPPIPAGIQSREIFDSIFERTKVEIQTFRKQKPIMGYIPTTENLPLVAEMIEVYLKNDIRVFGIDFSGSPLQRWLIRTVVSAIRKHLKIRNRVGEQTDKQYYIHVFNIASSKKSVLPVSPVADLLTHSYGVDSTSSVIWGGGTLEKEKLRIYNTDDYGAYKLKDIKNYPIRVEDSLLSGSPKNVYDKLRGKRLVDYAKECAVITEKITNAENAYGYAPHLVSKNRVATEVKNILMDIKEIKAH